MRLLRKEPLEKPQRIRIEPRSAEPSSWVGCEAEANSIAHVRLLAALFITQKNNTSLGAVIQSGMYLRSLQGFWQLDF